MFSGARFRSASLVGLLVVMVLAPLAIAEPAENGLELNVDIQAPENGLYYSDESNLEVTLKVKNHANQARELTYNPACPFDLVATSGDWELDLDDERICPTQSRAMMIQPGQERILSTWSWDWGDVASGEIDFDFTQPDVNLEATDSVVLHRIIEMPENLQLDAVLSETIGEQVGHITGMPAMIYLSLTNTGTNAMDLPFDTYCRVQTNVVTTIPCGTGSIDAGEKLHLGWVAWEFSELNDGDYTIPFTLTGVTGAEASVDTMYTQVPANPISDVTASASVNSGENLIWHFTLENSADIPAKFLFEDACIYEMHIIAPTGEIVYDTRGTRPCPQSGVEHNMAPETTYTFASDSWDYMGSDGCEIDDGLHLLVPSQPDHGLVATQPFMHSNSGDYPACGLDEQDTADIRFTVNGLSVLDADSLTERIAFDLSIENVGSNGFDLYWPTDCSLELRLAMVDGSEERLWSEDCDGSAGHVATIDSQTGHSWPTVVVPFVEHGVELTHGTWQLSIRTTSLPSFTTQVAHTFDGAHVSEIVPPQQSEEQPMDDVAEEQEDVVDEAILSGDWNYVTTPNHGCWLLTDSLGDEHSFIAHMQDGGWSPSPGLSGTYMIEAGNAVGDCSTWSGMVILQTLDETETAPEIVTPVNPAEPPPSTVDQIVEYAPASVAVVATTSLSILTLLYLGNTEWIRISALQVGIGLVGMVRRSGEHDGEYQRGRIMGYLTANPGVHFRALLGALEMSNGQLTHHLKHLQGEERIWRRKDGRLVRFYPSSIRTTLDDEELPVPLLTPDPNSLQGKILRLLDATENDIVNLSQKELAVRLEASQQLISHHLRTLEKFGLVEREKVGMRYRYQLTREAIFLVNSNDYDVTLE